PPAVVARQDVARPGFRAAEEIVPGVVEDDHGVAAVGDGREAGRVRTDIVALDHIAVAAWVGNADAAQEVTRDEVAGLGGSTTEQVIVGAPREEHAIPVAAAGRAGGVGAEEVALGHAARRAWPGEQEPEKPESVDDQS